MRFSSGSKRATGLRRGVRLGLVAITGLVGLGASWIAPAATAGGQEPGSGSSASPLSGPEVKDREIPGSRSTFGEGMKDPKMRMRPTPHPLFMRVVRSLGGEDTPENLRLDQEQERKIRAIEQEFGQAVRAFREEHEDEIQALREKAGMPGEEGGADRAARRRGQEGEGAPPLPPEGAARARRGAPGDQNVSPEAQAARQQLRALMQKGPKPDDYEARIWAVLSEPQQALAKERLEKAKAEFQKREMDGAGGPPAKGAKDAQGVDARRISDMTPEQRREALKNMTPEEREELRKRMRERRAAGGDRARGSQPQPQDKPAPDMDDVRVPRAD